ncbi:MAG: serine hydrolase, partial [Bacteroidota bacterium]
MIRYLAVLLLTTTLLQNCLHTQSVDMKDYNGDWGSFLPTRIFTHDVSLIKQTNGKWRVMMANPEPFYDKVVPSNSDSNIELTLDEKLHFKGELARNGRQISGYLQQMDTKFHLVFERVEKNHFKAQWRTFYVTDLQPERLYLAVENGQGDNYEAYPILPDNRYRGTYADYFKKDGNRIEFIDRRVGYRFQGQLKQDKILLEVFLGQAKVGTLNFTRTTGDWDMGTTAVSQKPSYTKPAVKEDGWETAPLSDVVENIELLKHMADSIEAKTLTHVHSVLMAHRGKLVYENYFNGFHADLPHDQRSAAKSIGSAMIGIALDEGILQSVHDPVYKYLPQDYQYTKDEQKAKISLEHLLTMSSGLDAIDFGSDHRGKATEDYY